MGCGCNGFPAGGGGTPGSPSAIPTWFPCFAFDFTDFAAFAALAGDVEIYSLPAACTLEGAVIKVSTPFAAPGLASLNLSVGLVGDLARYLSPYDAMAAASDTNFAAAGFLYPENFGAATSVRLAALAAGANLDTLTAGAGCLWLKAAKLT